MTAVASTAACVFWVHAMKSKLNSPVEGNPLITPPIFEPNLSAITVAAITHKAPMIKEIISLIRKT